MLLHKKQFLLLTLLIMSNIFLSYSHSSLVDFLSDFFLEKPVMITANLCWSHQDLTILLKILSDNFKLLSIYNNSSEFYDFLAYLSTNNYFILDVGCKNSWSLLQKIDQMNLFRFPIKYLLLVTSSDFPRLMNNLATYSIFTSSDVVVAKCSENYVELLQPYRIDQYTKIIWEDYGFWSNTSGLKERLRFVPAPQRRSNLGQTKMNVSIVVRDDDTFNHLEDFKDLTVDMFAKQTWLTVKCLLEYCNVNYRLLKTDDFGYLNKTTGRWSGVIGDLCYGKAQLSASMPLIYHDRLEAVDFLVMLNPTDIRFLLRQPPLSYMTNIFLLPFYWTVWLAIAVVLCLFALATFVILNWETKYKAKINFHKNFGINDILLIVFEILCQQGTMVEPRSIAGRTISVIFLAGFMFLYVAYSANIVALLQSTMEITSLEQLLASRMGVGVVDIYYMKHYLTNAKDRVRQELYRKKIGPKSYYPLEEGLEKMRQGFFAFHVELGTGYYQVLKTFTDYEMCSLQELEGYAKSPGGFGCVPKNSPYKEIIKVGYLKIEEYGLRKRNFYRVYKKPKCYSKGASFDSVGIMDVYPALLLWIYGVVLSLLIFGIEKLLCRLKFQKKYDFEEHQP